MTPAELLAAFRQEVRDEVAPYLWSNAEIYRFMDRAQKDFCRDAVGIGDSRSAITRITLVSGLADYKISSRITKIRAFYRTSDGEELPVYNFENLKNTSLSTSDPQGKVQAIVVGMDQDYIRVVPTPVSTVEDAVPDTIRMLVYRMPICDITGEAGQCFEIQDHHHINLIPGIAAQAYRKQDAETYDNARAERYATEFKLYCAQSKAEHDKREHKPREMSYGGL